MGKKTRIVLLSITVAIAVFTFIVMWTVRPDSQSSVLDAARERQTEPLLQVSEPLETDVQTLSSEEEMAKKVAEILASDDEFISELSTSIAGRISLDDYIPEITETVYNRISENYDAIAQEIASMVEASFEDDVIALYNKYKDDVTFDIIVAILEEYDNLSVEEKSNVLELEEQLRALYAKYRDAIIADLAIELPESLSEEELEAMILAFYDSRRDEIISEVSSSIATEPEPVVAPEPVVEEPQPVEEPEPVVEEPIVRTYSYAGYTLTATVDEGKTILEYPRIVTNADVNTFFALENEKYGFDALGVDYSFAGAGKVELTYPEEYAKEDVAAELDKLFADLTLYLPLVRVYEHEGYALTATINTGMTLLEYPEFITNEEVDTFFALENEKYGLAKLGVVYTFGNAGNVVLTYPSEYSKETVAAELDKMVEDLIAYITPAELPVIPVVPVVPVIPLEPAVAAEDESAFEFSLLLDAGVLSAFDNSFKFDDVIFANVGLGLNFANIISGGDHFGLGLRTDLDLSFLPKETGKWDLEDKLDYFNVFVYGEMISLDLKLMMDFYAGPADIYIGGGAGFAIGNPYDAEAIANYLGLDTFDIGQVRFAYDWFASATAGVRFRTSDLFSIGAEVNYRYMVTSQRHMGSANLIMGFTF